MVDKTIVAMAIGDPGNDVIISNGANLDRVRPYIKGLINGLNNHGHGIGTKYVIDYRERAANALNAAAFTPNPALPPDHVIFGMSTTVVRAAQGFTTSVPIVGIVSAPEAEGFVGAGNICGVSAKRSQSAGECLKHFLQTVPRLKDTHGDIHVLHKQGYGPSQRALGLVGAMAAIEGVNVIEEDAADREELERRLGALPVCDPSQPAKGLLVLAVDVFLGAALRIITVAHGQKKMPTFFPVTDWVKPALPSALGGYGVPQDTCGVLLAEPVHRIWQNGTVPPPPRFTEAPNGTFKWVASRAAAQDLNVSLGSGVPTV